MKEKVYPYTHIRTHTRVNTPASLPHYILSLSSLAHLNKLTLDIWCACTCAALQTTTRVQACKEATPGSMRVPAQVVLPVRVGTHVL